MKNEEASQKTRSDMKNEEATQKTRSDMKKEEATQKTGKRCQRGGSNVKGKEAV